SHGDRCTDRRDLVAVLDGAQPLHPAARRPERGRLQFLLERQEVGRRQRLRLEGEPCQAELLDLAGECLDQRLADGPDRPLEPGALLLKLREVAAVRDQQRTIAREHKCRRIARERGEVPDVALGADEEALHVITLEPAAEPFATLYRSIHAEPDASCPLAT